MVAGAWVANVWWDFNLLLRGRRVSILLSRGEVDAMYSEGEVGSKLEGGFTMQRATDWPWDTRWLPHWRIIHANLLMPNDTTRNGVIFACVMPYRCILLLAATPTALAWRSELRRRSRKRSNITCNKCDYDLAGLAGDAACPECGRERDHAEVKSV